MPLYEYECAACGKRFEVIQKFSDPPPDACRLCGKGPARRMASSPAIQFKGSGFYITDYAKKTAPESGGGASKGDDSKSDAKSATGQSEGAKGDASRSDASKGDSSRSDTSAKSDSKADTKSDSKSGATSDAKSDSGAASSKTPSKPSSSQG